MLGRLAVALLLAGVGPGCSDVQHDHRSEGSAVQRLQPAGSLPLGTRIAKTVYVPVYSSIYVAQGRPQATVELTATISVRNVSPRHALLLTAVRYYDSTGNHVRDYIDGPRELRPLGSVEFVVPRADTVGGPGANFLIDWSAPSGTDDPVIEAIMTGQSGNAGISFTSSGRTLSAPTP
jgi:hypothetical protein